MPLGSRHRLQLHIFMVCLQIVRRFAHSPVLITDLSQEYLPLCRLFKPRLGQGLCV